MITFFSIPKPFAGHIGVIQRNAIQSWCQQAGCQVILLGDDSGVGDVAAEFGATWIPRLRVNEYGTPLLNSAFDEARKAARHGLLCYVNADILLLGNFLEAASRVRFGNFLMLGQRWDLDLKHAIDFADAGWQRGVRDLVAAHGVLHPPMGSDYFAFPRDGGLASLPPFAVGRPAWDNWMIYRARRHGIPVVDATQAVMIVHQNHDYAHVKARRGSTWEGPEADQNRALVGGPDRLFTLAHATHRIVGGAVIRSANRGKGSDLADGVRRALWRMIKR
jgi:hypothetical protein